MSGRGGTAVGRLRKAVRSQHSVRSLFRVTRGSDGRRLHKDNHEDAMDKSPAVGSAQGTALAHTLIIQALITEIANTRPDPLAFVDAVRRGAEAAVAGVQYGGIAKGSDEDQLLREAAQSEVINVFANIRSR